MIQQGQEEETSSEKIELKRKIDTVLAALPELIRNANEAAKDHSRCLKELMASISDSCDDRVDALFSKLFKISLKTRNDRDRNNKT